MSYLEKQIQFNAAISKMSAPIRQAIIEIDIDKIISVIGTKYSLVYNEIGEIYEEVQKRLTGETPVDAFLKKIESKLNDEHKEKVSAIVKDINDEIFVKIREALRRATTNTPRLQSESVPEHEPELKREDLLAHIENPQKIAPPVPKHLEVDWTIPEIETPAIIESRSKTQDSDKNTQLDNKKETTKNIEAPTNLPTGTPPPTSPTFIFQPPVKNRPDGKHSESLTIKPPAPQSSAPSLLQQKLTQPTSLPTQKSEYKVDPYREQAK